MASAQDRDVVGGHRLALGTPRRLPKASALAGRVAVLDIAFAGGSGGAKNSFDKTTLPLIEGLGARLVAWIDHHDSQHHARYRADPRFVLSRKSEHGACPELVTPELVARLGPADTILCHNDFDGLASAAKWILGGEQPYPECDADARAIDTRVGSPSATGLRFDRAIRAAPRDAELSRLIALHLVEGLADPAKWARVDALAASVVPLEREAARLADHYRALSAELVVVDVDQVGGHGRYDKTWLLLLGQERAKIAAVLDGDTVTFAAPFDSGVDFLQLFGLTGGMPTLVSLHRARAQTAFDALAAAS